MHQPQGPSRAFASTVGLLAVFAGAGAITVWLGQPAPRTDFPAQKNSVAQRAEDRLPLIAQLDNEALVALIQRLCASDLGQLRPDLTAALTRLAERDPSRALELARAARERDLREGAIGAVIRAVPPAALAELIRGLEGRERIIAELASLERDPEAALHRIFAKPTRSEFVAEIFAQLAQRLGGPAALARAETLPNVTHRPTARLAAARSWVSLDAKSALAWALQLPATDEQLLTGVLYELTQRDPARVVEAIGARWPVLDGPLIEALKSWAESDWSAALGWVRSRTNPVERRAVTFGVLKAWIQRDAPAALAEATRLEFIGRDGESLVDQGASLWLRANAAEAARWFNGLPPGQLRNNALAGFVRAINRQDPARRLPLLDGLNLSAEDVPTVGLVFFSFVRESLETPLQWAFARPDQAFAAACVSRLADLSGANRMQPDAATILHRWFARPGTRRDSSDSSLVRTAARLLQGDPRGSPPDTRWVRQAPPVFVWQVFRLLTRWNPEQAVGLAATLSEPELQAIARHAIEVEWRRTNPARAQAWIERDQPQRQAPAGLPADVSTIPIDEGY